ncbi:hypothetical protein MAR_026256 [Mya arenaria]|uniref:Uncharacterized protein n=1 Tax=Mya arenaria TaxID=6604 RepID=A0ABY7ETG1_MYAAR|nr:hypothetical protein MAR_026256 [Mya arenaria]
MTYCIRDQKAKEYPYVPNAASELVTHLLKSQLLMSPALWQLMFKELARALPIMQVDGLRKVYKIFTSLTVDPGVKKSAGSTRHYTARIIDHLITQPFGSTRPKPCDVTDFKERVYDKFIDDVTNVCVLKASEPSSTSCEKVDGLRKVYEIFTSLSVDPGMKKSAVDQLAIIHQGGQCSQRVGDSESVTKESSLIAVDGSRKVYEIFTSLSVDPGVKKSAVDQLAIILQVALLLSNDDRTCYETCTYG